MSNGIKFGSIPKLSPENVIIIGSGPSLKGFDFNLLKDNGLVISVNNAVNAVPFSDIWFTLDPWGLHGPQLPKPPFKGKLVAAVPQDFGRRDAKSPHHRKTPHRNIVFLQRLISHNLMDVSSETAKIEGLSEDPRCVSTGNSGYGALNIAYHLRPQRILLLGIDCTVGYFYTDKEKNRPLAFLPKLFESAKPQLDRANITVINGSPNSAIKTFPRHTPNEAVELLNAN